MLTEPPEIPPSSLLQTKAKGRFPELALLACLFLPVAAGAQPMRPMDSRPQLAPPAANVNELISRARLQTPQRVAAAERLGAKLENTSDGRSFGLIWQPAGKLPAGWIVTLHGSASWAYDEVVLWQPFAERNNLGIVALQWWFGGGQRTEDYYLPRELRRELEHLMRRAGATRETTLLHGFSRGAANLYALAAFDAQMPNPLFRAVIANSGGMTPDFPPNRDIDSGRPGAAPFAGTRWWLYCGGGDPNPDRDGCLAMRRTRDWLAQRGAEAQLAEDASGDHGGFHRNPRNVEQALGWFLKSRAR